MSWRKNRRQEDPPSVIDAHLKRRYEVPSPLEYQEAAPGESLLNVSPEGEVTLKGVSLKEGVAEGFQAQDAAFEAAAAGLKGDAFVEAAGFLEGGPIELLDPNAGGQVGSGGQSLDDFRFARPTPEHQVPEHYGTLLATSGAIEVLSTPFGTWRWHIADHELVRYAGGERQEASWLLKTDDTVKMVTKKAARKEYERLVKETKP